MTDVEPNAQVGHAQYDAKVFTECSTSRTESPTRGDRTRPSPLTGALHTDFTVRHAQRDMAGNWTYDTVARGPIGIFGDALGVR